MTISPVYEKSTKRVIANGSKSCIVTSFLVFSIRSSERNKVFLCTIVILYQNRVGKVVLEIISFCGKEASISYSSLHRYNNNTVYEVTRILIHQPLSYNEPFTN